MIAQTLSSKFSPAIFNHWELGNAFSEGKQTRSFTRETIDLWIKVPKAL